MGAAPFEIPERFNAATFFVDRHVGEGRGGQVAFHHDSGTLTYAGLQALVNRTGNAFRELGLEREQRVLCLLLDSPEFLAAFWGAIKVGAVPVPINTMLRGQDYLYFLNDSRARILVVSEALYPVVAPILGEARFLQHVVVTGKPARPPSTSWWDEPRRRSRRRRRRRTTPLSGSTPPAPPASRRGPFTSSTTWSSAATPTRCRCWA